MVLSEILQLVNSQGIYQLVRKVISFHSIGLGLFARKTAIFHNSINANGDRADQRVLSIWINQVFLQTDTVDGVG